VLLDEKNNVCVVCMFVCDSENAYCVDDVDEEDSEKIIRRMSMQPIIFNIHYYHFLVSSCIWA
jgi:hypothetical protein